MSESGRGGDDQNADMLGNNESELMLGYKTPDILLRLLARTSGFFAMKL